MVGRSSLPVSEVHTQLVSSAAPRFCWNCESARLPCFCLAARTVLVLEPPRSFCPCRGHSSQCGSLPVVCSARRRAQQRADFLASFWRPVGPSVTWPLAPAASPLSTGWIWALFSMFNRTLADSAARAIAFVIAVAFAAVRASGAETPFAFSLVPLRPKCRHWFVRVLTCLAMASKSF